MKDDAFLFDAGKIKTVEPLCRGLAHGLQALVKRRGESGVLGRVYEEKGLNAVISEVHQDYCTIRRDRISEGILTREDGRHTRIK